MDNSDNSAEHPLAAIDTVARFSGLSVTEIMQWVCSKMQDKKEAEALLRTHGLQKHLNAICTVCRFAGVDMKVVCERMSKNRRDSQQSKEMPEKKVA